MTERDIIQLAKETRDAQKAYFKNRTKENLSRSMTLEYRLDKAIDEYLNPDPQMDLFG